MFVVTSKVGQNISLTMLACICSQMKWTWMSMCLFHSWNLGFSVNWVALPLLKNIMIAVLCEQYKESSNQCNQIALVDAQESAKY